MRVLLILPAYNEEAVIEKTVRSVERYRCPMDDVQLDYIVINDGSTDGTGALCREKAIRCLDLVENLGIGGAVQMGYQYAAAKGYDVAVQFDGDGQHDITSLPALLEPFRSGQYDFVVGSRFVRGAQSEFRSTPLRRVGIRYLSGLIHLLTGQKIADVTSGYRAANRRVILYLAEKYPVDYPEPEALVHLIRSGMRVCECSVNMFERAGGRSSIHSLKSVYYMVKVTLAVLCAAAARGK